MDWLSDTFIYLRPNETALRRELLENLKNENLERCKQLLDENIHLDAEISKFRFGWNKLHWAAYKGDLNTARSLIKEKKVNVNTRGLHLFNNPLMIAANRGHLAICQLLYENGADLNAKCEMGYSAFVSAAINEHVEICNFLEEKGADLSGMDVDGLVNICNHGCLYLLKRCCLSGALLLPDLGQIFYLDSVSDEKQIEIDNYISKQPIRQSILILLSPLLVRRLGTRSPIRILSVDVMRELFATLADSEVS